MNERLRGHVNLPPDEVVEAARDEAGGWMADCPRPQHDEHCSDVCVLAQMLAQTADALADARREVERLEVMLSVVSFVGQIITRAVGDGTYHCLLCLAQPSEEHHNDCPMVRVHEIAAALAPEDTEG